MQPTKTLQDEDTLQKVSVGSAQQSLKMLPTEWVWDSLCGDWAVLHVKSRQEKALESDLRALALPCYLPIRRIRRLHGGRRVIVEEPMFPGYVFIRGSTDNFYQADRTNRVVSAIRVVDQARLDWELRNLRIATASDVRLDAYPALSIGVRVEVCALDQPHL